MSIHMHSTFTFLRAVPQPEEIARRAAERGMAFAVLTDENLHGSFRFWRECRRLGIKAVFGLCLGNGTVLYARSREEFLRLEERGSDLLRISGSEGAHYLDPEDAERCRILRCIAGNESYEASLLVYPLRRRETWCDTDSRWATLFEDYSLEVEDTLPDVPLEVEPYREEPYRSRLEHEIDVVTRLGFRSYFAILADLMAYARFAGIPSGPGRGSAAGSLLAYRLGITRVDPVKHGLLFERFLNADRVSPPDIDVDFAPSGRSAILQYLRERYGEENVVNIAAFSVMRGRSAFKDCAKIFGLGGAQFQSLQEVARMMPDPQRGMPQKISDLMTDDLEELMLDDSRVAAAVRAAALVEGAVRHATVHAGGVVICRRPAKEYIPVTEIDGTPVTAWDKDDVEAAGVVKFDLLGVSMLDVVEQAKLSSGAEPDMEALDDPEVYRLCAAGQTQYVFQLGSYGMRQFLRGLRPSCFAELADALALFRPGPLDAGMSEAYLKHSAAPVFRGVGCLGETRGVVVYQEQVMQIARDCAGFSLADADLLRRAMGKKKPEEMAAMKKRFLAGGGSEEMFDSLAWFAGYAFNKSHAVAYAMLSYQTAWYKVRHPVDYMCAVLCVKSGKQLETALAHARSLGVCVLTPDVRHSQVGFSVEERGGKRCVRTGLSGLPHIQETTARYIVAARGDKPFSGWKDYRSRVPARGLNKQVLASLASAGALFGLKPGEVT
ncbi:MAG: DNA polymerase III subunit alpha [Anaerolineae bacterium]|nr:DNA polymerase III subunit alpha [Anaerolineae bacterium]